MDEEGVVVERGQKGELHIGSDALTPGYMAVMERCRRTDGRRSTRTASVGGSRRGMWRW